MSHSVDPGHFFQSEAAQATASRKAAKAKNNTAGNPIKLPSKILAILTDPRASDGRTLYVAESAGLLRRVGVPSLESQAKGEDVDLKTTYRGPTAPLTSIALSPSGNTLFSGCWDKTIWSWDVSSRQRKLQYHGHSDFVKSVITALVSPNGAGSPPKEILISGSGDSTIIIWDIASGTKLATIRDTGRILDLAIDPASFDFPNPFTAAPGGGMRIGKPATNPANSFTLYTASSDPEIRCWKLEAQNDHITATPLADQKPLTHDTSINSLYFTPHLPLFPTSASDLPDWLGEEESSVLYTGSSDKTARSFTRDAEPPIETTVPWSTAINLEHPDFVRAVLVDTFSDLIVTACRDEEVRVWDASAGTLVHVWRGHFEEVTGLGLVKAGDGRGNDVVSVSIDGTIRCWSLDRGAMGAAREKEKESGKVEGEEKEDKNKGPVMTAEEEAELAELMDSDDE